jgi:flagellar biogenesis protein FliO
MRRQPATRPALVLAALLAALLANASAHAEPSRLAVARRAGIADGIGAFAPARAAFTLTLAQTSDDAAPANKSADDVLKDVPNYGRMLTQMLVALGAIVVVLLVAAKLLPKVLGKRFAASTGAAGNAKLIEIVETRRLDPRTSIHLVKVAEQYFLIGSTGDRVQTLAGGELDSEAVEAALGAVDEGRSRRSDQSRAEKTKPFADVLKHADAPSSEHA